MLPDYGFSNSRQNIGFYRKLLGELNIDIVVNQRGLSSGFDQMLSIGDVKKITVLHTKPNAMIDHDLSRMLFFSNSMKEQIKNAKKKRIEKDW